MEAIAGLPVGEPDDSSPYLEIKVKVTQPDPTLKYKIQEALKGKQVRLARIVAVAPPKAESSRRLTTYEEVQQLRPIDIALDFYKQKYGGSEMPDALQQLFNEVAKKMCDDPIYNIRKGVEHEDIGYQRKESGVAGRRI